MNSDNRHIYANAGFGCQTLVSSIIGGEGRGFLGKSCRVESQQASIDVFAHL